MAISPIGLGHLLKVDGDPGFGHMELEASRGVIHVALPQMLVAWGTFPTMLYSWGNDFIFLELERCP